MKNISSIKSKYIIALLLAVALIGMLFNGLLDFTASVKPEVIFEQTKLTPGIGEGSGNIEMTLKVRAELNSEEGIKSGRFAFAYDNDYLTPLEQSSGANIVFSADGGHTNYYTGSATHPISEAVATSAELNAEKSKYIAVNGDGKFNYIYFEYDFNSPNMQKDADDYYVIATMKFKMAGPNTNEFHRKTFDYDKNYKTYITTAKGGMDFITGNADTISNSYYYGDTAPEDYTENPQSINLPLTRRYTHSEAYPVFALRVFNTAESGIEPIFVPKSIPPEDSITTAIRYEYRVEGKEGYGYDSEIGNIGPSDIKWRFVSAPGSDKVEIDPPTGITLVENENPGTEVDGTSRYGQILIDRTAKEGPVYIESYYYGKSGGVQTFTIKKEDAKGQEIRFVQDINKVDLVNPDIFGKGIVLTAHWYDQYAVVRPNKVIITEDQDYKGLEIVPITGENNSYYLRAMKGFDLNNLEAGTLMLKASLGTEDTYDIIKNISIVKAEPILTTLDFKYGTEQAVDIPALTEPVRTIVPDIASKDQYGKYIELTEKEWTMEPSQIEGVVFNAETGAITVSPGATENENVQITLKGSTAVNSSDELIKINTVGILQSDKTVTTVEIEPIGAITTPTMGSIKTAIAIKSYDQYGHLYSDGVVHEIKAKGTLPKGVSIVLNNNGSGYDLVVDNTLEETTKITVYLVFGIKTIEREIEILRDISVLTKMESISYPGETEARTVPYKSMESHVSKAPTIIVLDQYGRDITKDAGFKIRWELEGNTDDKVKINESTGVITIEPCALNQNIKVKPSIDFNNETFSKVFSAFTIKRMPNTVAKRYIKSENTIDYPLYPANTLSFKAYIETQYGEEEEVSADPGSWKLISYEPSSSVITIHATTGIIKLENAIPLTKVKVSFRYKTATSEEKEITIKRQISALSSIVIDAACLKEPVPTPIAGVETRQMTAIARDQYGVIRQDKILWALEKDYVGVSINADTGILSVDSTAKVTSINIIAKSENNAVSHTQPLRLDRQISKISNVKIENTTLTSDSGLNHGLDNVKKEIILNSATGHKPVIIRQSAYFYNQYDERMDIPRDAIWEIKVYNTENELVESEGIIKNTQNMSKYASELITTLNPEIKDDYTIKMRVYSPSIAGIEQLSEYKVIKRVVARVEIIPQFEEDTTTGVVIEQYMVATRKYTAKFYDQYGDIVHEPKAQEGYNQKDHWKILRTSDPAPNPNGIFFDGKSPMSINDSTIWYINSGIIHDEKITLQYEFIGAHSLHKKVNASIDMNIIKLRPTTASLKSGGLTDITGDIIVKDEVASTRMVDVTFKDQKNAGVTPAKVKWTLTNIDGTPYTGSDIVIDKPTSKTRVVLTFKYSIPEDRQIILKVEGTTNGYIVKAQHTFNIKKSKATRLEVEAHNGVVIKIDPINEFNNKKDYAIQVFDQFNNNIKAPSGGTWKIYNAGTNTEYTGGKITVQSKTNDKKIIGTLVFDKSIEQATEAAIDIEYTYDNGIPLKARFNNIKYIKRSPWAILFEEEPPRTDIIVSDVQSGARTYKIKFRDQWNENIGVPPGVRWELRKKGSNEIFTAEGLSIKNGSNNGIGELVIDKNLRLSCEFDVCAVYTRNDGTDAILSSTTRIVKLVQTRVEVNAPLPLSDIHITQGEAQERIYGVTFYDQNNRPILTPSDFEWKLYKKDILGGRVEVNANDNFRLEKLGAPGYGVKLIVDGDLDDDNDLIIEAIYKHPYTEKTMTASFTQKVIKLVPKTLEIKADGDDRITIYHGINQTRTFSLTFKDQFGDLILPPNTLQLSLVKKSDGDIYNTEHIKLKSIDNYNKVQLDMSYLQPEDINLAVKIDFNGKYKISEKHYISIVKINPVRMEMSIEGKSEIIVGVSKEEEVFFTTNLYDQYNCIMLPPYGYIWSIENKDGTPYIDKNLKEPGLTIQATEDAAIGRLFIGKNFRGTEELQIRAKVKGHENITEVVPIKIVRKTIIEEEVQNSKEENLILNLGRPDIQVVEIKMENNETELSEDVFEVLKKYPEKSIKIISAGYTWEFKGSDIKKAIPLNTKLATKYSQVQDYNTNKGEYITMLNINFDHVGDLPGMASIRIKVDERVNKNNLMFYYYNKESNAIEYLEKLTVDKDGYINIKRDHCSSYFIINGKIPYEYKDVVNVPWARDSIVRFTASSILTGYGNATFKPMQSITRGELAQIVAKTFNYTIKEDSLVKFKDVDNNKWYAESINILASNKIVGGYEDKTFRPNVQARGKDLLNILNRVIQDKKGKVKEEILIDEKMLITRAIAVVMIENIVNQMKN